MRAQSASLRVDKSSQAAQNAAFGFRILRKKYIYLKYGEQWNEKRGTNS